MYLVSLLIFYIRKLLVIIGVCTLTLLAITGVRQQSGVTVRSVKVSEETTDYTYRAEIPQVHGLSDGEVQMLINEELKAVVERERRIFVRDAMNVSMAQTGATLKSGLTVTYRIERADDEILSLLFIISPHFFGADQANHFTVPFNYDVAYRSEIKLEDVFTGEYLPKLSVVAREKLKENSKSSGTLSEGKEKMIESGAAPRRENYDSFSIKKDSVIINFDPTEVAPYAEGIQQITISGSAMDESLTEKGKKLLELAD